jgi:5-methyltetrahydrofolate--homocysteine methyltransferase
LPNCWYKRKLAVMERINKLNEALRWHIVVIDGAMGTMLGRTFADCKSHLATTNSELIANVHRQYLEAGAEIISTDSSCANSLIVGQDACATAFAAAKIARNVVDDWELKHQGAVRWVAGCAGPVMTDGVEPEDVIGSYVDQMVNLMAGGADFILLETMISCRNIELALCAVESLELPFVVSMSVTPDDTLADGASIADAVKMIEGYNPLAVGINCSYGSSSALSAVAALASCCSLPVMLYPSAGIPDKSTGVYPEDAGKFVANMSAIMRRGLVNAVGGCCGTTPEYIRQLAAEAHGLKPLAVG